MFCMFCLSNLDSFRDGCLVAVQLLFCGVLLPGFVQFSRCILVQFSSGFFFIGLVSVRVVHPLSRINTIAAWKKLLFILSDKFDFHMIYNLSIENIHRASTLRPPTTHLEKPPKLDEQGMWDRARLKRTTSWVIYCCGPLHSDQQEVAD